MIACEPTIPHTVTNTAVTPNSLFGGSVVDDDTIVFPTLIKFSPEIAVALFVISLAFNRIGESNPE